MNYLAHVFLAHEEDGDPDFALGALLGDFAKGVDIDALPEAIAAGVRHHRAVDVFTDAHPAVIEAKRLFAQPLRRFAGIVLDVAFDHFLAADFERWSREPLGVVTTGVYGALQAREHLLPPRLRAVAPRMIRQDWLGGYADPINVRRALAGIGSRMKRDNPLRASDGAADALWSCRAGVARAFEATMADLLARAPAVR